MRFEKIDVVAYEVKGVSGNLIKTSTEKQENIFNSCRFCPEGIGVNKVTDENKNETFYLCDKHLAQYNQEKDELKKEEPAAGDTQETEAKQ